MSTGDSNSWWWSALSAAKEKSVQAFNATRRDISEFVSVIQNDTASAISSVSSNLKVVVEPSGEQSKVLIAAPAQSSRVQSDSATYLNIPGGRQLEVKKLLYMNFFTAGEEGPFSKWKDGFRIQDYQEEISKLLVTAPHVRSLHTQLVPVFVSYELFWQHYWYKVSKMKQAEEKRAQLVARVTTKDEQWLWDDEPENVSSTFSETSQSSLSGMSQPLLPGTSQPSLPGTLLPSLPGTSQPSLPGTLLPSLPDTSQPSLPDTSQPLLPGTLLSSLPDTSQPSLPGTSLPGMSQLSWPDTSLPSLPGTSQPMLVDKSQPSLPGVSQPQLLLDQQRSESSDSFVCIAEDTGSPKRLDMQSTPSHPPSHNSDSDWERWDD